MLRKLAQLFRRMKHHASHALCLAIPSISAISLNAHTNKQKATCIRFNSKLHESIEKIYKLSRSCQNKVNNPNSFNEVIIRCELCGMTWFNLRAEESEDKIYRIGPNIPSVIITHQHPPKSKVSISCGPSGHNIPSRVKCYKCFFYIPNSIE
jgi:hypothetical protein